MHQKPGHGQRKDAAQRAHQIDDGVSLAAQGLGGHVRHQRHGRRTIGAHGDQQQPQRDHEQQQFFVVVRIRQDVHQDDRRRRAAQNKGHAPSQLRVALVGQLAEEGQQEQRQHVIHGHDHAHQTVLHVEGVLQNQGNHIVVQLPERADGQERKAHQQRPFVVQFHLFSSVLRKDRIFPAFSILVSHIYSK